MAYTKYHSDWKNFPDTSTPITEAALDWIESGIQSTAVVADAAIPKPAAPDVKHVLAWNGSAWVSDSVTNARVADAAAIAVSKLAPGSEGNILTTSGGVPAWGSPAGAIPAGIISPFGGSSAPTGWLLCDGSAVSTTTYAALFAVVGVVYGNPGGGNFNLPDLRGRTAVGKGTNSDVLNLGNSDGVAVGTRRPKHAHTVTDTGHTHTIPADTGSTGANNTLTRFNGGPNTSVTSNLATTGISVGSAGMTDTPAYLVINYIIKT